MFESSSNYHDHRSKQVVYVSSCILNQNRRFPGIALYEGAILKLVEPIIRNNVGIDQLPCLECLGWGGISRQSILRFASVLYSYTESRIFPFIKRLGQVWLKKYKRVCKRKAREVIKDMKAYLSNGYNIISIIAMNDSPTCGVTKTISIFDLVTKLKEQDFTLEDIKSPHLKKMREILPNVLTPGQGFFMSEVIKELKREKIVVPVLEFNPWSDLRNEVDRLISAIFENPSL